MKILDSYKLGYTNNKKDQFSVAGLIPVARLAEEHLRYKTDVFKISQKQFRIMTPFMITKAYIVSLNLQY